MMSSSEKQHNERIINFSRRLDSKEDETGE